MRTPLGRRFEEAMGGVGRRCRGSGKLGGMRRSVLRIAVGIGALALAAALTYRLSAPASSSSVVSTSLRGRQAIVLIASLANGQLLAAHDLGDARQLHLLPGSAIKPWTALALLRAKVVADRDRLLCRRVVPSFGPRFACSHPPLGPVRTPARA